MSYNDQDVDQQYKKHIDKITRSWNKKKRTSSKDLSAYVPFVDLYSIYNEENEEEKNLYVNSGLDTKAIRLKLDKSYGGFLSEEVENIRITPIAQIESQMESSSKRGGIGITSLRTNKITSEPFSYKYNIDMVITDTNLINKRKDLTKLLTLNSYFILLYGWSGFEIDDNAPQVPQVTTVTIPPENSGGESQKFQRLFLDQLDRGNGNWDWSLIKLYQFNFNIDAQGHLNVSLSFVNAETSNLSFGKVKNISTRVLRKIKEPRDNTSIFSDNSLELSPTQSITDTLTIGSIPGLESIFYTYPKPGINYKYNERDINNAIGDGAVGNNASGLSFNNTEINTDDENYYVIYRERKDQTFEKSTRRNNNIYPYNQSDVDVLFGDQISVWPFQFDFQYSQDRAKNDGFNQQVNNEPSKEINTEYKKIIEDSRITTEDLAFNRRANYKPYFAGVEIETREVFVDGDTRRVVVPLPIIDNIFDEGIITYEKTYNFTSLEEANRVLSTDGADPLTDTEKDILNNSGSLLIVRRVRKKYNNILVPPPWVLDVSQGAEYKIPVLVDGARFGYFIYNLQIDITDSIIVNTDAEAAFYNTNKDIQFGGKIINEGVIPIEKIAEEAENLKYSKSVIPAGLSTDSSGVWPVGGGDKFVKPTAITSAQLQKFINQKRSELTYGQTSLLSSFNDQTFRDINKTSIFINDLNQDGTENQTNINSRIREKVSRGSIIFDAASIREAELEESGDTTDSDLAAWQRVGYESNSLETFNTLKQTPQNLRIDIVTWAEFVINNNRDKDFIPFNIPERGTRYTGAGAGQGRTTDSDSKYSKDLINHIFRIDSRAVQDTAIDELSVINTIQKSYDEETNSVILGKYSDKNKEFFYDYRSGRYDDLKLAAYKFTKDNFFSDIEEEEGIFDIASDYLNTFIDDFKEITGIGNRIISKVVIEEEVTPRAYYLGAVLEAIKNTINESVDNKSKLYFYYSNVPDSIINELSKQSIKILTLDGEDNQVNLADGLTTTFDLPVDYRVVDDLLMNVQKSNSSVIRLLKDMLSTINQGLLSGITPISLSFKHRPDKNDSYEIYVASRNYNGIARELSTTFQNSTFVFNELNKNGANLSQEEAQETFEDKTIALNFGERNSLVDSFNISSKIDPLSYAAFRLPTNFGLRSMNVRDLFSSQTGMDFLNDMLVKTSKGQGDLFDSTIIRGEQISDVIERISNFVNNPNTEFNDEINNDITTLLLTDPDNFTRFVNAITTGDDIKGAQSFVSDLLVNFLFSVDATLHGTTGLYLFDPIIVNNFVSQSGGVYIVNSITENISKSNFNTVLGLKLHTPFKPAGNNISNDPINYVESSEDLAARERENEAAAAEAEAEAEVTTVNTSDFKVTYKTPIGSKVAIKVFYDPINGNEWSGPFYNSSGEQVYFA